MFEQAKYQYLQQTASSSFQPKAALIDMDGVLFDSMPHHAYCWTKLFRSLGFSFEEKEAYMHEGRTGKATLEILYRRELQRDPSDEEVKELYGRKAEMFDNMPAAPIMKDADALLDCIRDAGMQRILVTGSGQTKLFDRLNEAFPGHFNENSMVTAFDVKQGKPFPEPYLMGLKKAGVAANEAIVIENAPLGVQAGRAAGIFTIAVNTGLLEDEVLLDAGCNLLFHNMSELKAAWPEIIKAIQL